MNIVAERFERILIIDKNTGKGVDVVFTILDNKIVHKHVDYLKPEDWGEKNGYS